jgi:hypothetical protein
MAKRDPRLRKTRRERLIVLRPQQEEETVVPPSSNQKRKVRRASAQSKDGADEPMEVDHGTATTPRATRRALRSAAKAQDEAPYRPGTPTDESVEGDDLAMVTEDEEGETSAPPRSGKGKAPSSAKGKKGVRQDKDEDADQTPVKAVDFAESPPTATRTRKRKNRQSSFAREDAAAFRDDGDAAEDDEETLATPTKTRSRGAKKRAIASEEHPDQPVAGGSKGSTDDTVVVAKSKGKKAEQEKAKPEKRQTRSWTSWLPFSKQ